jgi:signal transduction histidine kinase
MLEALFYAAPVGFALLDRGLRILKLNEPMLSLLGEGGGTDGLLSSSRLGAALAPICREVIETGDAASQALFTQQRRYHALVYPVTAPEIRGLGLIIADVKSVGSCPMDALKRESIARLSAGIAHHFNNLLTGVMGGATLALEHLPPGHPARSAVEIIIDSGKRAVELTHHLLAYSGGLPCRCVPVDMERVILDACERIRGALPARVKLQVDSSGNLPEMKMEEFGVQEALRALLLNAAEAIGDQEGTIRVAAGTAEVSPAAEAFDCIIGELAEGRYLKLDISDTGCGMDAETKAKMFEPFFSTKLFGRGLGLASVQRLVRLHHGCVRVESEPGHGTTISIFLRPAPQGGHSGGASR